MTTVGRRANQAPHAARRACVNGLLDAAARAAHTPVGPASDAPHPHLPRAAMKCSAHKPARPPTKYRGVNVGGFLVLEPWIAPSLFYQFLDAKEPKDWAMDMYTFCQVLGPEEGNRQLRRHWQVRACAARAHGGMRQRAARANAT